MLIRCCRLPSINGRAPVHHLPHGHEAVSLIEVTAEDQVSRAHRLRPVGTELFVTAVMQQYDVAAAHLLVDGVRNVPRGIIVPVPAADAPHHRLKTHATDGAQDRRSASAVWRPEEAGVRADGFDQRALAALDLGLDVGTLAEDEVGMRPGMVTDLVSRPGDSMRDVGATLDEFADQEERRAHL